MRDGDEPNVLWLLEPANTDASSHAEICMASGVLAPLGHTSCRRLFGGCTNTYIID